MQLTKEEEAKIDRCANAIVASANAVLEDGCGDWICMTEEREEVVPHYRWKMNLGRKDIPREEIQFCLTLPTGRDVRVRGKFAFVYTKIEEVR
jgi:hypothetical protein